LRTTDLTSELTEHFCEIWWDINLNFLYLLSKGVSERNEMVQEKLENTESEEKKLSENLLKRVSLKICV